MDNNLDNQYVLRAIEAYPYELERALEALNYALSYNPENSTALCLMAKLQHEQLSQYTIAKHYYQKAIAADMDNPDIYPDYIRLLVNHGEYDEAEKLIVFALKFKGTKKASILLAQASFLEATEAYSDAKKVLEEAKLIALNDEFVNYVDSVIARLRKKEKMQHNINRVKETVEKKEVETTKTNWFQNRLNNLL